MIVLSLLLVSVGIFAQDPVPPTTWLEAFANINMFLATLAGVSVLTVFVAGTINTLLKTEGFVKQLVAWVVCILLLVGGNLLNMGFMSELTWLNTVAYGVAGGFVANGIFDVPTVLAILKAIGIGGEKKEP